MVETTVIFINSNRNILCNLIINTITILIYHF
jgi:hypothetical protein